MKDEIPHHKWSPPFRKGRIGVNTNVFWLGLVSFFNDFSNQMVQSVMPVFLTVTLGATPAFVGFIDGFADALAALLRIVSGWWSDRIGKRKRIIVFGYALSVLTRWFLVVASGVWQIFFLRAVDRVGKGLRESPRDALVTESVEKGELGRAFGFQRALDALGGVVGPIGAIILLPMLAHNYRSLFLVASGLGVLALFSFFFVKDIKKPEEIINGNGQKHFSFGVTGFRRDFKLFLISLFVFGLGFMPIALVALKVTSAGLAVSLVVVMYLVYTVSYSAFSVPFGKLADRVNKHSLIALGFVVAIASYFILAFSDQILGITIGFIILGIYSAITDGVQRAFGSTLLDSTQMASGHGFLQGTIGVASLVGGTVGGLIWTMFGAQTALIYGAVMMALGLLFFIFVDKGTKEVQLNYEQKNSY